MQRKTVSLRAYWELARGNANFRRLWLAQIVSELGDWFYMVALYAMLLEFTGRAEPLGIAFVLQVLPAALVGPMAGVIIDRVSRKRLMIATDLARCVIIACVLLVRSPQVVWLIYPLLFAETVMWGIFEPARTAVIPNIVKDEDLLVANTLSSATWSMNLFLGSALGGLFAVWLGRDAVYALDASTFLVSALLISRMRFMESHVTAGKFRLRDAFDYSPMLEGLRYVRSQSRMLPTMLVKAGIGVTGASWVIFPILGTRVFPWKSEGITPQDAGMIGMSILMGARGLGTGLGPIVVAPWAQQKPERLRRGILFGFFLYAAGYAALAMITHPWTAYAVVVVSHMGGAMVWVFSTTVLQTMAEDKFRGRVFSTELAMNTMTLAASSFLAGYAMDHGVGVRTVLWATGAASAASGCVWAVWGMGKAVASRQFPVAG